MKEGYPSILLFGPPGSGKGTMGKLLASGGDHYHLSSGDIFRGLDPKSALGKTFREYADQGRLVPDELTIEMWESFMENEVKQGKYQRSQLLFLDGIPRTVRQVKLIEKQLDLKGVISLEVADKQVLIDRLLLRSQKEGRADDRDEAVLKTRLEVYERETKEILSHFPEGLIERFDANQPKIKVLTDILVGMGDCLVRP